MRSRTAKIDHPCAGDADAFPARQRGQQLLRPDRLVLGTDGTPQLDGLPKISWRITDHYTLWMGFGVATKPPELGQRTKR